MDDYIQQLLREQGVPENLDPAVRQELVTGLTERATEFLNRRLIDAMSDEAVEQFTNMLEAGNPDAATIQGFIATNVPNRQQVTTQALIEFRALYLGDKA